MKLFLPLLLLPSPAPSPEPSGEPVNRMQLSSILATPQYPEVQNYDPIENVYYTNDNNASGAYLNATNDNGGLHIEYYDENGDKVTDNSNGKLINYGRTPLPIDLPEDAIQLCYINNRGRYKDLYNQNGDSIAYYINNKNELCQYNITTDTIYVVSNESNESITILISALETTNIDFIDGVAMYHLVPIAGQEEVYDYYITDGNGTKLQSIQGFETRVNFDINNSSSLPVSIAYWYNDKEVGGYYPKYDTHNLYLGYIDNTTSLGILADVEGNYTALYNVTIDNP